MPESNCPAKSTGSQTLTAGSTWKLIISVRTHLHGIARQNRRDRWWFLSGSRFQGSEAPPPGWEWTYPPESVDLKANVAGNRLLVDGRAPELSCVVRVGWNRGPQRRPLLLVDFFSRSHGVTIEVRFGEQRAPAGIFTKRAVRGLSIAERRTVWREYRQWFSLSDRRFPRELLWIDPRVVESEEVTRFVILLYLCRHKLFSPVGDLEAWHFVKTFLRRWGVTEDGEAWEVLNRLQGKFGFPERPKGVLGYVGRVVRDLRPKNDGGEVQMDAEAAQEQMERRRRGKPLRSRGTGRQEDTDLLSPAQVAARLAKSRESVYRWAREGILVVSRSSNGRLRFGPLAVEAVQKRIEARGVRLALTRRLVEDGKKPEAAKKFLQRRLRAGMTLLDIARQLRERRSR